VGRGQMETTTGRLKILMRKLYPNLRTASERLFLLLVIVALAGCQFEPSITPIPWPTLGSQPLQQATLGPQPSPIPVAPTPLPTAIPFLGAESLLCGDPKGGDNHFGFCAVPGSDQYYIWAECSSPCPDGPYPGVELRLVADTSALRDYMIIIKDLDQAIESKKEGIFQGGALGFLDFLGGVLTFGAACMVGDKFSFGLTCAGFFLTVGSGGIGAYLGFDKSADSKREQHRLEESASNKFREMP